MAETSYSFKSTFRAELSSAQQILEFEAVCVS